MGRDDDEDGRDTGGLVGQQGLLPTANDPGLWLVQCKCVLRACLLLLPVPSPGDTEHCAAAC